MKLDWSNRSRWNYETNANKTWHVEHVLQFVDDKPLTEALAQIITEKLNSNGVDTAKDVTITYNNDCSCYFVHVNDVLVMEKINEVLA